MQVELYLEFGEPFICIATSFPELCSTINRSFSLLDPDIFLLNSSRLLGYVCIPLLCLYSLDMSSRSNHRAYLVFFFPSFRNHRTVIPTSLLCSENSCYLHICSFQFSWQEIKSYLCYSILAGSGFFIKCLFSYISYILDC